MKSEFIVMKKGQFLTIGSGYSPEYPEANIFRSRTEAKRAARSSGKGSKVVRNYGHTDEEVVYEY